MSSLNANPLINFIGNEVNNLLNNLQTPTETSVNVKKHNINTNLKYYKNISESNIIICIEIPGFLKEDCNINLEGGYLVFEGTTNYQFPRNTNFEVNDFDFIQNKNVIMKIDLCEHNIDQSNIKASFNNGLLKIKLKKKPKMNINID